MTTELRQVIVEDIRARFSDELAERLLNKDLIKSLADFYQTEENYRKHSMAIPLDPSEWLANVQNPAIQGLIQNLSDSIQNKEEVLFVVDNDREAEVARVAIAAMSEFLERNDVPVTIIKKDPTEFVHGAVKNHIKANSSEGSPLNIIGVGVGYNSSLKDVGFENFGNVKQAFIDSSTLTDKDDLSSSIATKNADSHIGFSQVLSTCLAKAIQKVGNDGLSLSPSAISAQNQLKELAHCEHQSRFINAPVSARASDIENLTKYSDLQSAYNFQESLGWAIGLKYTLGAGGVSDFHKTLELSGVDPESFNDSVSSIYEANISANVVYDILKLSKDGELPLSTTGKPQKFSKLYNERLLETVPLNLQQLSSVNALKDLRETLIALETKQDKSEIELSALKQLKTLSFKLRGAVKGLKDNIKDSDALEFIRGEESSVAICKHKHGIEKYIDDSFLNSIHKKPLDGVLISYPEATDESARLHLKMEASSLNKKNMLDSAMQFKMGGMDVSMPYNGDQTVVRLDSNVKGRGVDNDTVRRFATTLNSVINQNLEKLSKSVDSVIVAEPDTLGEALDLLNYVGAGHSNSVDPNVNLRIPKKMPLRVTLKGTGEQKYMTIDEITSAGIDSFSTFEVMYTDPDPAKKASPKSLFVDASVIAAMSNDVGKKRFYGPLRLAYSSNGISGKLHVKGYDPSFSIRYKKDVVLKPSKVRHQTSDRFWADMKKVGNVERSVPEVAFKNVNGVDINKHENYEVFKTNVLEVIDRLNGGVPDVTGDAAYWCLDTETTGLSADADLLNFGAAGYSVKPDTGLEVESARIVETLSGGKVLLKDDSSLEEVESPDDLSLSELNLMIRVGEHGSEKVFKFDPKTVTSVENSSKIDGFRSVINRELQLDYISALVKTDEFSKVPTFIEELSGVSTDQINKYGVSVPDLESIFTSETNRFKSGNAFAIHNAPFDVGVLSRQSKAISNVMASPNNIIVDTNLLAGGSEPLLYNEPDKVYSITSTGSAPVEARFTDKEELEDFLRSAVAGDRLEGEKGAIEISKRGLLTVFATHKSTKGKGCKAFDDEDRSDESLGKVINVKEVMSLPSIEDHRFENRNKLISFLEQAQDGSKMSDIFGAGYIAFNDGKLISVKSGVASSSKVIGLSTDNLLGMVGTHHLNSTSTRTNMETLMGFQKVIDLIKSTLEIEKLSESELTELLPDLTIDETVDAMVFSDSYDYSKSLDRNIENFQLAHNAYLEPSQLKVIGKSLISKNSGVDYAYKNKSSLLKVLKSLDKEKGSSDKAVVAKVASDVGVDLNTAILASNMIARFKKGKSMRQVFRDQSHCNAERFNSDVMTELMIATNMANNKHGNNYSIDKSIEKTTGLVAEAAIKATRDGYIQNSVIDTATFSSAPIFASNARKHSAVRDRAHSQSKTLKVGTQQDRTSVDIETNSFDAFKTPESYKQIFEAIPTIVAAKKIDAGMYPKGASSMVDKIYDAGVMDLTESLEANLAESGVTISGVGVKEAYQSLVQNLSLAAHERAIHGESIGYEDPILLTVPKEKVFEVKRDVLAQLHCTSGATRLMSKEVGDSYKESLAETVRSISGITDVTGDLYNNMKSTDSDVLVANGNNISSREQSIMAEAVFQTPYVKGKVALLNTSEISGIRERADMKNRDQELNKRRMVL